MKQCVGHCGVLCHHSPAWIPLAFGQDPSHSNGHLSPYMWYDLLGSMALLLPPSSSFASGQYLLLCELDHSWATSSAHFHTTINHACASGYWSDSYGSYHSRDKVWNVAEGEPMEILSRDKVPLRDNRGAHAIHVMTRWHGGKEGIGQLSIM